MHFFTDGELTGFVDKLKTQAIRGIEDNGFVEPKGFVLSYREDARAKGVSWHFPKKVSYTEMADELKKLCLLYDAEAAGFVMQLLLAKVVSDSDDEQSLEAAEDPEKHPLVREHVMLHIDHLYGMSRVYTGEVDRSGAQPKLLGFVEEKMEPCAEDFSILPSELYGTMAQA